MWAVHCGILHVVWENEYGWIEPSKPPTFQEFSACPPRELKYIFSNADKTWRIGYFYSLETPATNGTTDVKDGGAADEAKNGAVAPFLKWGKEQALSHIVWVTNTNTKMLEPFELAEATKLLRNGATGAHSFRQIRDIHLCMGSGSSLRRWNIRQTMLRLCESNGWTVLSNNDPESKNGALAPFFMSMPAAVQIEQYMTILALNRQKKPAILLFRPELRKPYLTKYLEAFQTDMPFAEVVLVADRIVMQVRTVLEAETRRLLKNRLSGWPYGHPEQPALKYRIFEGKNMVFPVIDHELQPRLKILDSKEREKVLERYQAEKLPSIDLYDPVAHFLGAELGDILEVIEDEQHLGETLHYRHVTWKYEPKKSQGTRVSLKTISTVSTVAPMEEGSSTIEEDESKKGVRSAASLFEIENGAIENGANAPFSSLGLESGAPSSPLRVDEDGPHAMEDDDGQDGQASLWASMH